MYVTSPHHFIKITDLPENHGLFASDVPDRAITRTLAPETMVFYEGDTALHVYEILEGVVKTSKVLSDGRRQIVAFGYPGDIIGISHDCEYHCDCETVSETKLRVHRKNACSASTETEPDFCSLLMKHAAAEMSSMQEHFLMLGRKSALERICSFLSVLLERVAVEENGQISFTLPMARSDIADFLGLTIETVSRSLTHLRKEGVIELPNPHKVIVCNASQLRQLAERDE